MTQIFNPRSAHKGSCHNPLCKLCISLHFQRSKKMFEKINCRSLWRCGRPNEGFFPPRDSRSKETTFHFETRGSVLWQTVLNVVSATQEEVPQGKYNATFCVCKTLATDISPGEPDGGERVVESTRCCSNEHLLLLSGDLNCTNRPFQKRTTVILSGV